MGRKHRNQKVTFLSPPAGQDTIGGPSGSWTTYKASIWASVVPILGNEYFAANAAQSDVRVKIECAWFSGVVNNMRITHGSDTYEILDAINVNNYNHELLCYCKKVS